jgi:hypothetical protein
MTVMFQHIVFGRENVGVCVLPSMQKCGKYFMHLLQNSIGNGKLLGQTLLLADKRMEGSHVF